MGTRQADVSSLPFLASKSSGKPIIFPVVVGRIYLSFANRLGQPGVDLRPSGQSLQQTSFDHTGFAAGPNHSQEAPLVKCQLIFFVNFMGFGEPVDQKSDKAVTSEEIFFVGFFESSQPFVRIEEFLPEAGCDLEPGSSCQCFLQGERHATSVRKTSFRLPGKEFV